MLSLVTAATAGGTFLEIWVSITGEVDIVAAPLTVPVRVTVDGVQPPSGGAGIHFASATDPATTSFVLKVAVGAGAHTINLDAENGNAASSFSVNAASKPATEGAMLLVHETSI